MRKNYGRSLLLTSSVLIGAVSLPLLISCGAESHEGDKQTETGGGTGVTQAATVAVTEVGTQPTATETSTGEEATGLEKLVTLYKELGKGLVEQEDITKKVEALSKVVDHVNKLGESYKEFTKAQVEVKALKSQVRFAKSELDLAQDNNYRLGKEIMLYLLGFKLIWGAFTGYAPTTSWKEQAEKLEETKAVIQPKIEAAQERVEEAKEAVKEHLAKVVATMEEAITTFADVEPTLQKRLTTSKWAFVDVVGGLLEAEEEFAQREEILLKRYLKEGRGLTTQITAKNTPKKGGGGGGQDNKLYIIVDRAKEAERKPAGPSDPLDSVSAGDFGLSAVGNFEKSTFSFAEAKLAQQRRRFEHLTQVIPTGSEGRFAKLSPAVVLSEIVAKMSAANTKVVELRKQVSDQEQVVTEEEKSLVDGKISATATEVAKVQQERELSNSKLSESYSAIKTLDTLTERAHEIFSTISAASHTKALLAVAADRVLQAENALRTAEKENVSFFRELALYTIGFKWLWGSSSGYAPTVDVTRETTELLEAKKMFEEESKVLGTKIGASMNDFSTKLTAFDLLTENILGSDKTDQITKQVTRAFKGKFKEIVAEVVTKQMTFDALRDETVKSLGLQDETFSLASVAAVNSFKQTLINSLGLKLFEKEEKAKTGAAISMGGKGFVELFGKPAGVPSTEVDSLVAGLIKEETALSKFKDKLVDFVRESQGGILTQTFEERVAMTEELKKSVSEERVLNFVITMLSRLVGKEEEAPAEETETTAGEEEVAEEAAQEESWETETTTEAEQETTSEEKTEEETAEETAEEAGEEVVEETTQETTQEEEVAGEEQEEETSGGQEETSEETTTEETKTETA